MGYSRYFACAQNFRAVFGEGRYESAIAYRSRSSGKSESIENPLYKDAKFPQDYIKRDIHELEVKEEYVSVVRLIREYCKNDETESKLQIRIYQKDDEGNVQFFHSKCYIFLGENYAKGIIGSSNFTQKDCREILN